MFATWGITETIPSPPSCYLKRRINQPVWCCETSKNSHEMALDKDDIDDESGDVWQENIYGAWTCIVPCLYVTTSFTMLFYESFCMRLYEWWISEILNWHKLWFLTSSSWRILAAFSLECCQDLLRDKEVENLNTVIDISFHFSQLASWKQYLLS